VVKKAGAWITYDGEKLGQGLDAARKALKAEKKSDLAKIIAEIKEKISEEQKIALE